MFSILILTYNREVNLPNCLKSVRFFDDIVVLNSGNLDETVAIAELAGAGGGDERCRSENDCRRESGQVCATTGRILSIQVR